MAGMAGNGCKWQGWLKMAGNDWNFIVLAKMACSANNGWKWPETNVTCLELPEEQRGLSEANQGVRWTSLLGRYGTLQLPYFVGFFL